MVFEKIQAPIVRISSGEDRFDITKNKTMRCFLNGNAIIDFPGPLNCRLNITPHTHVGVESGPIIGLLVRSAIQRPNTLIEIKAEKTFSDFVKSIIDSVNKSKQEKIRVLEEKPDEMRENTPSEFVVCAENLNMYREQLKIFAETFEDAIGSSEILLKTSFPKTMWGAKELKGSLLKIKTASTEIYNEKESFEIAAEQSDYRVSRVTSCLFGNARSNRKIAEDSINHIITNFLTMKRIMASFLQSFHSLYTSDQLFKKYSGYPATWFFDPSVFYNFLERYEDVSSNLIETSRIESSVIRPLDAWKSKVTGV